MKKNYLFLTLLCALTITIKAQIPVTDVAANTNATINQIVNYSTWTQTLQKTITQASTLTTTLSYVQKVSSTIRNIAYTKDIIERQARIVKRCKALLKKPRVNERTYKNLSSSITSILTTNNQLISLVSSSLTSSFKMNDSERMNLLMKVKEEQTKTLNNLSKIDMIMSISTETQNLIKKDFLK